MIAGLLLLLFAATIIGQALRPARRVEIVLGGAGVATALGIQAGFDARAVLANLPWDVLIILGSLGVISQVLAESRLFTRLAVAGTRLGRAKPTSVLLGGSVVMFFVSGLVNNLTALLLVLPVVIAIFELVGTSARNLRWTVGTLLVACNLGGAATPIGDFPAILLLGAGAMAFDEYLILALPTAFCALLLLLLLVHFVVRPARDVEAPEIRRALTVAAVEALHRRIRLDPRLLVPASVVLAGMVVAWAIFPATVVPPHVVAWLGAALVLAMTGRWSRHSLSKGFDLEATLFLFGLFVLVGVVKASGFFTELSTLLLQLPVSPRAKLVGLIVITGVATGLFSAGPSMAAMLEVGRPLAESMSGPAVYIGLAFGVCAGSSLLLTAATSGPLAQSLVERAGIEDDYGRPLTFSFHGFLPVGVVSFAVILTTGVISAWVIAG